MDFFYSLYDALVSTSIATKSDIQMLQRDIEALRRDVAKDLELLRMSMTVRLDSIQVVACGILFAALKLT